MGIPTGSLWPSNPVRIHLYVLVPIHRFVPVPIRIIWTGSEPVHPIRFRSPLMYAKITNLMDGSYCVHPVQTIYLLDIVDRQFVWDAHSSSIHSICYLSILLYITCILLSQGPNQGQNILMKIKTFCKIKQNQSQVKKYIEAHPIAHLTIK